MAPFIPFKDLFHRISYHYSQVRERINAQTNKIKNNQKNLNENNKRFISNQSITIMTRAGQDDDSPTRYTIISIKIIILRLYNEYSTTNSHTIIKEICISYKLSCAKTFEFNKRKQIKGKIKKRKNSHFYILLFYFAFIHIK